MFPPNRFEVDGPAAGALVVALPKGLDDDDGVLTPGPVTPKLNLGGGWVLDDAVEAVVAEDAAGGLGAPKVKLGVVAFELSPAIVEDDATGAAVEEGVAVEAVGAVGLENPKLNLGGGG